MCLRLLLVAASLACSVFSSFAATPPSGVTLPLLQQQVTDLTGSLSPEQQRALTQSVQNIEQQKGAQVALLMLPSTAPEDIEQFSIRLAEAWKIGRKKIDDGVLIIVAKNDKRMRLEVGYGLEGVIPDAVAKRIVSEIMAPHFKQNDYFGGIQAAVAHIDHLLQGETLPPPTAQKQSNHASENENTYIAVLVGLIFAAGVLRTLFGRLFGSATFGVLASLGAWFLLGSLLISAIIGVFACVIALIVFSMPANVLMAGGLSSRHGRLGGGFGGGGFSGGGGGFGGGGASGSW